MARRDRPSLESSGIAGIRVRSGDPLFAFDGELRILSWNQAAEDLTGISAENAVGRRCWELLCGVDRDGNVVCHARCSYARLAREGWPGRCHELLVKTPEGRRRVAATTVELDGTEERVFLHVLAEPRSSSARAPAPQLTPRQREVLELMAAGIRAQSVAARLGVSEATARNHIRAVLAELDAHSQLEAVAKARRLGVFAS